MQSSALGPSFASRTESQDKGQISNPPGSTSEGPRDRGGHLPIPSLKSFAWPAACQSRGGLRGHSPRPGSPFPPVNTPRLQVAQRPLIKSQHLLLVGQVGPRRQERHDSRFTFSCREGSWETGRQGAEQLEGRCEWCVTSASGPAGE